MPFSSSTACGDYEGEQEVLAMWVPRLIIATAVIHCAYGLVQPNEWANIVRDGVVASVVDTDSADYFARDASVWFMMCGIALLAIGVLTRYAVIETGRIPASVGWFLVVMGIPLTLIYFPVTGGWLVLAIGVIALLAARRGSGTAKTPTRTG
ncbi:DUF6463 family protein [Mycolicibacterium fortuitum]|nr:DUF6463 family protein [Mycolicibacterium fortuitum]AIY44576.2 hypothetical protein G155_02105 [Mycobacterium sp. VKM Ac-1817D]AMD53695.1 hypothetical protein ATO49_01810 [Mycolicibacterium fortuitum subsp. fortuitum DSM 46621 = ATCC 6841 = JCM 6387]MCA4754219.1 hypothetical protein [Mycolicibacterium fortuitum]MDG5770505.1 DUF6463 family protein [Mycolicibacterium fortuitum]MDG5781964.1 DUF6463 family protein [Mycolicibacterium fortuitum]